MIKLEQEGRSWYLLFLRCGGENDNYDKECKS